MADPGSKKRSHNETTRTRPPRPSKKQKKIQSYHSDSDEADDGPDFQAVNLLDSDDPDLDNVDVDDGASSASGSSESENSSFDKPESERKRRIPRRRGASARPDDQTSDSDASDYDSDGDESDAHSADPARKSRSKRNDPAAFATSLSKILNTKLSSSRRADPVLARSADAHAASRALEDSALEAKARKVLREQKRAALEKGRVKDVLVASANAAVGEHVEGGEEGPETTAQIMETERRLRKIAQRGVVKLFNAVRAAQVKASEAERASRAEGVVGSAAREERVTEMSRKGFLDLIASGGGGLKKGRLET